MTEKLYYKDQYLKEIKTEVEKTGKLDNKPYVILKETIFYPEGGGQPSDTGYINEIEVIDVQEIDGQIYHFLNKEIESNTAVCKIDWKKRLDNMQQHTGQHILSGIAYQLFNAQTVGFHLGTEDTTVDFSKENFSVNELSLLEEKANEYVINNYDIVAFFPNEKEIANLNLRKKPKDFDKIRIVNVKNLDYSPCGGTHFKSTAEVGLIKIIGTEKIRGNTRLHILCGNRALKDYTEKTKIITDLIELTNSPQNEIIESVKSTLENNKEISKKMNILKEDFAIEFAKNKFSNTKKNHISLLVFNNEEFDTIQFRAIANYFQQQDNILGFIYSKNNGSFILFKSETLDINLKELFEIMKNKLNCKGGGSGNAIQGKIESTNISAMNDVIKALLNSFIS